VPRQSLEPLLKGAPTRTRIWIDETYIEYAGQNQSLESFAAQSENVIICKSMSKVYALSGVRAAYLCGPPPLIAQLRTLTPPWTVSLPAQVAVIKALEDPAYYTSRYFETHTLRQALAQALLAVSPMEIIPGVANFLLCHLPPDGPDAATVVQRCRADGLFVRNAASMGSQLGHYALRVAVKDAETNHRIVEILNAALNGRATSHNSTFFQETSYLRQVSPNFDMNIG
jgi:histidinol-phosphate/aromatic aminotransferase/cobyric acid decarboxylase-like protein